MLALEEMYPGKPYSPITTLINDISATDATITVADGSVLPPAPNYAVIGSASGAETIFYAALSAGVLSEVQRGIQEGGAGQVWAAGTPMARYFTEADHAALIDNIQALNANKLDTDAQAADSALLNGKADTAFATAAQGAKADAALPATATAADSAKLGGAAAATYAPLASPAFTGAPTVPTPDGTVAGQAANVEFVAAGLAGKAGYNYLINGDFLNPVNQRGQTSYSATGYAIDRWLKQGAGTVTLSQNGVVITGSYFEQIVENFSTLVSDLSYTLSITLSNGDAYSVTGNTENEAYALMPFGELYMRANGSHKTVVINVATGSITLVSAKLEIGDAATPFVPRLFAEELAICQRYYEPIPLPADLSRMVLRPISSNGLLQFIANYKFTTSKRVSPTVVSAGTFRLVSYNEQGSALLVTDGLTCGKRLGSTEDVELLFSSSLSSLPSGTKFETIDAYSATPGTIAMDAEL